MISLFIDTSLSDVSIALLKNEKILAQKIEKIPNEHSKYTVSYIDEILKKSKTSPKEVEKIYAINGPGSFTGIRIGLTISKVYAYILNIKVTLISTLKALALSVTLDKEDYILSLIDAKNDNFYVGLYDKSYKEIEKEHFTNIEEVKKIIEKYKNMKIISSSQIKSLKIDEVIETLDIEKIVTYYKDKEAVNAHMVMPSYLKAPGVTIKNV